MRDLTTRGSQWTQGKVGGHRSIHGHAELGKGVGPFVSQNACVRGDPRKADHVADECAVIKSRDGVPDGPGC